MNLGTQLSPYWIPVCNENVPSSSSWASFALTHGHTQNTSDTKCVGTFPHIKQFFNSLDANQGSYS